MINVSLFWEAFTVAIANLGRHIAQTTDEERIEKLSAATGLSRSMVFDVIEKSGCTLQHAEICLVRAARKGIDSDGKLLEFRSSVSELDRQAAIKEYHETLGRGAHPLVVWAIS